MGMVAIVEEDAVLLTTLTKGGLALLNLRRLPAVVPEGRVEPRIRAEQKAGERHLIVMVEAGEQQHECPAQQHGDGHRQTRRDER